ncbi:hypothetical protein [Dyella flagellata]|uniref:DUF2846 domain-containing protein n=1 Tax=Dyella flagellata TaxID=1867833 RepID=A0ABQ5XHG0_9GAMM|nr:hypothetical protein [Dyella flagellata]GLQ90066.1 hypothetical protein GCM10007898_36410 [Dyella flagellata]
MHYLRTAAVLMACTLAAGCSHFAGRRPLLGYADKNHPAADTALVVCGEPSQYTCGITGVNQVATWEKFNGGKTPWVRVLPGKQMIKLTLSNSHLLNRQQVVIDQVEAGHVYRIDVGFNGAMLTASYQDLGRMDSYTIHMPRFPFSPKAITASF